MISARDRDVFDELLDREIDALPATLLDLLERVPLIVDDEPSPGLLNNLGLESGDDLCGLHDGTPLTELSVDSPVEMPEQMMLFRGPIARLAGFGSQAGGRRDPEARRELRRQIHITLLHEIGHHFGLDEADLDALGYG